ncbi:CidA/LrgA family protein [Clostridium botulinum]|uniref:Murein hydrolase transporter LrgA n=1 Tax=Clostridium botulinum TaxID=1491 RepID=A0A9Q1ZDD4_CLOBO|nr:CidA/LrgA family protein [Clostridium botulinum]AEB77136.1 LrgA family protein [Clostridium botulinum BKT015925]KEI00627.1 murein hydrolase transporter LrgA [Clostridium botulinum D str. 16868]KEI00759.1 murein hydrolase transporter LrgA [Clostridium botulinum C/D str. Sp77]KLU75496.1 murein hydrolase transporter LrgA [Clostridium botulinum V891]KOA74736.1 murein hydrolase transporter LrgA [Clostridium botulinum]
MKLLRQVALVLGLYFLGLLIQQALKLPIPGSVLGMIILLILLCAGIVKVDMIEDISNFLLDNLAFFFVPAGVGLLSSFTMLKGKLSAIVFVSIISTIIIIAFTGLLVELMMKGRKK